MPTNKAFEVLYTLSGAAFADAAALLADSPSYQDPYTKIRIDKNNKVIEFGCSLMEIKASFPTLLKKYWNSRPFDEENLDLYSSVASPWEIKTQRIIKAQQRFIAEAESALHTRPAQPSQPVVIEKSASNDPNQAFLSMLMQHPGIVLGEAHHNDVSPKKILIDNIKFLQNIGVKRIYFEHLMADTQGEMLQHYFSSQGNSMPKMLEDYLNDRDKGHGVENHEYNFLELVKALKIAGIEIIPIDTRVSYSVITDLTADESDRRRRYALMNYTTKQQLEHHNQDDGKYIIFCGAAHVNEMSPGIPGVAQIAGIPSVVLADNTKDSRFTSANTSVVHPDVLIIMDPNGHNKPIISTLTASPALTTQAASSASQLHSPGLFSPAHLKNDSLEINDILQGQLQTANIKEYPNRLDKKYLVFSNSEAFETFKAEWQRLGNGLEGNLRQAGQPNTFEILNNELLEKIKTYCNKASPRPF